MSSFSERYSRQIMLPDFGEEGQQRLCNASVLLVGAGGLGSAAATYITGAGVGHIGIADPDVVSLSNLQRQTLYGESQIGMPKVECARERLESMSSTTRFTLYPEGITVGNAIELVSGYGLVLDCTDNFPTRYLIDDVCAEAGRTWVHGAVSEFHGQVTVFNYKKGRRYAELYPDRDALCSQPHRTSGIIGAVPGVVGAIEASEAIKILAGIGEPLEGRLFMVDLLGLNTALIEY